MMTIAPLVAALAGALAIGVTRSGSAADHIDSPAATGDPAADITDVYTFTSPENPKNLVLMMNVGAFGGATKFSDKVDYVFRIRKVTRTVPLTLGTDSLDVRCIFDNASPQHATCTAPGNITATVNVEDKSGGATSTSPMRVFAGKRSDPFFFDLAGFNATVASGKPSFTGTNTFDKANVLSLVVEVDAARAFGAGDGGLPTSVLTVAGETTRKAL
jgi:hypothetical protein